MSDAMERPVRGEHGAMLDYLADRIEAQSEELLRFIRIASDRMLTTAEVQERLRIKPTTYYEWKANSPWKLPNFGARCSMCDFYDWFHVPGVINADEYHRRQWDQMNAQARKEALGVSA